MYHIPCRYYNIAVQLCNKNIESYHIHLVELSSLCYCEYNHIHNAIDNGSIIL